MNEQNHIWFMYKIIHDSWDFAICSQSHSHGLFRNLMQNHTWFFLAFVLVQIDIILVWSFSLSLSLSLYIYIYIYIERGSYENANYLREYENGRQCIKSYMILHWRKKSYMILYWCTHWSKHIWFCTWIIYDFVHGRPFSYSLKLLAFSFEPDPIIIYTLTF